MLALIPCWWWLIDWYLLFISDIARLQGLGTELMPLTCYVVVALQDKPSLLAGHGMFNGEACTASVAPLGEVERSQSKPQSEVVPIFFGRQNSPI